MGSQITTLEWRSLPRLWPNQKDALKVIDDYLAASISDNAALIQMPTGSGKTAIIAVSARLTSQSGDIAIVVSPSRTIADQLEDDIAKGTWMKLRAPATWSTLSVTTLLRSNNKKIRKAIANKRSRPQILVGTLQALNDIRKDAPELYDELRAAVGVIYVDEGHREPAQEWSKSVQLLDTPTVLFSATPYRNDYRAFHVHADYVCYRSFDSAVSDGLIRDVKFETLPSIHAAAHSFAIAAVNRFDKLKRDGRVAEDAKAILRFKSQDAIKSAMSALKSNAMAKRMGFAAVHEGFDDPDDGYFKQLDIRDHSEHLFLHQFKLCEGIDEPKCAILFLHDDFSNERQLVQQIGRCIRRERPRDSSPEPSAIVITLPDERAKTSWEAYRIYDKECAAEGRPPILNVRELAKVLREVGLQLQYADRKFRLPIPNELDDRPEEINATRQALEERFVRDVIIPRKCVVYESKGASFDKLVNEMIGALDGKDRHLIASAKPYPSTHPTLHVLVCLKIGASPYFDRFSMVENSFTVTVLYQDETRTYLFDSGQTLIASLDPSSHDGLRKLLPERKSTRVTMAATRNTDLSIHSVRSREISVASLRDTPPSLTDFLSIVSRARGIVDTDDGPYARYIGFFSGRVSDSRSKPAELEDFVDWCDEIGTDLDSSTRPATAFQRYANAISPPKSPVPQNILLDIDQDSAFKDQDGKDLYVDDYCSDIEENTTGKRSAYPWLFKIGLSPKQPSNEQQTVTVFLKTDNSRFLLDSEDLAKFTRDGPNGTVSALEEINRYQSFRLLLNDATTAYGYHQYYGVKPSQSALLEVVNDLLITVPAFAAIKSEKGDDTPGKTWDGDSIFGLFKSKEGRFPLRNFIKGDWDGIICDDRQGEVADFIAYRVKQPTVAFFHAKRPHTKASMSAASLHEVLAQGIKNLDSIRVAGEGIPKRAIKVWSNDWVDNKRIVPRILKGRKDAAYHYTEIEKLLRLGSTQRHVCILLAGAIKKTDLMTGLRKTKPVFRAMQAFLQLASFFSEVSSVGVTPTVLCD